jgi:adenylate cyclase class 2
LALEQEVKLAFASVEAARQAVLTAGGRLVVSNRLLDDHFFDTPDARLRSAGQGLRIRRDGGRTVLTWKGPVQPGAVKTREEIESGCESAATLAAILGALGYLPHFRLQKYREEYELKDATVTVDQSPVGVFVEIEGIPERIAEVTALLGRSASDYELASYVTLWRRSCEAKGLSFSDMVFDDTGSAPR